MGPSFADLQRSFYRLVARKCLDLPSRSLSHILLLSWSNTVEQYIQRSPVISAMYFVKAEGREERQTYFTVLLERKSTQSSSLRIVNLSLMLIPRTLKVIYRIGENNRNRTFCSGNKILLSNPKNSFVLSWDTGSQSHNAAASNKLPSSSQDLRAEQSKNTS
jgi:hypothetical protein